MKTVLVTPSYAPDFERCKLLIESAARHVHDVDEHVLLVDESDRVLFSQLCSDQVSLMTKESLLPWWIRKNPLGSRWWLSMGSLPVRGWIVQQVVKLAIAEQLQADVLLFADSDMVFVKRFDKSAFTRSDGRVRHFRARRGPMMYTDKRYQNWYGVAAGLCNMASHRDIEGSYIAQLNSWRHENVIELHRLIESQQGTPWMTRMLRCLDFSEFVLYGAFVDHVLYDMAGHYIDEQPLCHSSWFYNINTVADVEAFKSDLDDRHVAIHLQSNLGLSSQLLSVA